MKSKGTVLVTGGAKRIGRAISLKLAESGYNIALHFHHSRKEAEKTAKEIRARSQGTDCELFACDLSNSREASSLVKKVAAKCPDLCGLINNASIFKKSDFRTVTADDFDRDVNVNLRAPFLLISEFARRRGKGSVVNLLDTHVTDNTTAHLTYLLSKKALWELTKMASTELAPKIRVNAVAPGLILPPAGAEASYLEKLAQKTPLRRKGTPEEIARAVLFLLENSYVTGQTIFVDGGEHLVNK